MLQSLAALAKKLRTAPKTDPMIPSSAATAFPARRFKALDKCFSLSLTHPRACSYLLVQLHFLLPPPVSARTIVEIIPTIEVKIVVVVNPTVLAKRSLTFQGEKYHYLRSWQESL